MLLFELHDLLGSTCPVIYGDFIDHAVEEFLFCIIRSDVEVSAVCVKTA